MAHVEICKSRAKWALPIATPSICLNSFPSGDPNGASLMQNSRKLFNISFGILGGVAA